VGCVETTGSGCEFANPSAPFSRTFLNINNVLLQAINNGINPQTDKRGGLPTGYLYEMESFADVQDAFKAQLEYFMDWHFTLNNILEYVGNREMPIPIASATMDGCMESGRDITAGGAKYNSTGGATFGLGTLFDSLATIKYMVYDKKLCSARQLHDAVCADWQGYELLRRRIMNEVPHYGNGDPYADETATWAIDLFTGRLNSYVGARGGHRAGIYSAGAHVRQGFETYATPNGRRGGEPVSDGASPSQGADRCGPTGVAASVIALHPYNFGNGLQFCMKFHPASVRGKEGTEKLRHFVSAFFDEGGMQIQYNVVDSETLRQAQAAPEEYRDLVVRVAGFSAYFVELCKDLQDDLINRTDIQM
jgi:formate C-acetyltransferase